MGYKMYVIVDKDLNEVVSICKGFEDIMRYMLQVKEEGEYSTIEYNYNECIEKWYFTFPHNDPELVGHLEVYQVEVGI